MGYYYYCYRHWRMGRYRCRWWYKLWHCWFWSFVQFTYFSL